MTISSSLNAGVSGLSANASRLATISDNIANSSTYGYKRVDTEFSALVVGNKGSKYTAGGVSAYTTREVSGKGALISSSNALDLAVSEQGMLPIFAESNFNAGSPELLFTSTGSFRRNDEGYVVNEAGYMLLGFPANIDESFPQVSRSTQDSLEPIRFSQSLIGDPTTNINMALNLPATATQDGADGEAYTTTVPYYGNLGTAQSLTMTFTPTVPAPGDPATNEWQLVITDSASAGATVGDYLITFEDSRISPGQILSVAETVGDPYVPATGDLGINVAGGPLNINIGAQGEIGGFSQLSDDFAPISIDVNGSEIGNMVGVDVDANGYVSAIYDTGDSKIMYQIPIADLPAPDKMMALDGQTFRQTGESGPFYLWDAGSGPTGELRSYALEESTTDVAKELTSMIQTQRAYSSNAKIIQTVDEMLQETTNMKR